MGDEEHRAGERLQRFFERFATLDVEVIRRLVENEEVRAGGDEQRERQAPPFASRERAHRTGMRLPAGEEEAPEQRLRLRTWEPGLRRRVIEHRAVCRQLLRVLGEVAGDDAVSEPGAALVEVAPAEDRFEQRRLPTAVRADERDLLPALEHERRVLEQPLVAGGE